MDGWMDDNKVRTWLEDCILVVCLLVKSGVMSGLS